MGCWLVAAGFVVGVLSTSAFAQTLPDGAKAICDIASVINRHERLKLDLYLAPGGGKRPVVVWIHGGGWESGDKRNPKALGLAAPDSLHGRHFADPGQVSDAQLLEFFGERAVERK